MQQLSLNITSGSNYFNDKVKIDNYDKFKDSFRKNLSITMDMYINAVKRNILQYINHFKDNSILLKAFMMFFRLQLEYCNTSSHVSMEPKSPSKNF